LIFFFFLTFFCFSCCLLLRAVSFIYSSHFKSVISFFFFLFSFCLFLFTSVSFWPSTSFCSKA
jgi:hypothetical protein